MIGAVATDFGTWRDTARRLLAAGVSPDQAVWSSHNDSLFSDADRWAVLYRVLYRVTHGERPLLAIDIDDDVRRLRLMEKALRRDLHKMTAFVRFRRVEGSDPETFVAWYRPDHHIVEHIAPWFRNRFGSMRWSILTPDRSAHWDLEKLTFGPGVARTEAPDGDALEDLWRDYYASIFNPARVNLKAMRAEMPTRHWATLPEAQLIPSLIAQADTRVVHMATSQKSSAAEWLPSSKDLESLRAAAPGCHGCELYSRATQVVFGDGPPNAKVVMVGEQPGDEEDQKGLPFVGPAGRLLNKAMADAGLRREKIYVTNAVKHFKWIERGKRRIHAKPTGIEISACKPWLEAELAAIEPELVVCLGATAAQALIGREFRITADRGKFMPHRWAKEIVATIHPSAILRMPERFDEEYALLVDDLKLISHRMQELEGAA